MDSGTRHELLSHLAEAIRSVTIAHPTRVAIDGVPGAGKTTLADELAVVLRATGREVIRATIEDFLNPSSVRHPWSHSAEGWYNHNTDIGALRRVLLDPLGPGGDRRMQLAVYDKAADTAVSPPVTMAAINSVLLFDGVFLLREELFDRWDLRIFVSADFEQALARSRIRDETPLMSADEVEERYRRRYIPSQQFYFRTARPAEHADIIVYNDEPLEPTWQIRHLSRIHGARARRGLLGPRRPHRPMGHSSTRAAVIYLHSSDERQREIADALGDLAAAELRRKTRRAGGKQSRSGTQRARRRNDAV